MSKKSINKKIDCPLQHSQCIEDCFDINSPAFEEMMKIISEQKKLFGSEKLRGNEVHHIVPRAYYNKLNYNIDNSEENLVSLETRYHFQVHYYAWKCAKPLMVRSLCYAFQMMFNKYKKICGESDIIAASILYENFKNSKPPKKTYKRKYTEEELSKMSSERSKNLWAEKRDILIDKMSKPHNISDDFKLLKLEKLDLIKDLLSIDNKVYKPNLQSFIHFLDKNASMNLSRYNFQLEDHPIEHLILCKELNMAFTKKEWADFFSVSERTIQNTKNQNRKLFDTYSFEDIGKSTADIFSVMETLYPYYVNDPDIIYRIQQVMEEMVRINKG